MILLLAMIIGFSKAHKTPAIWELDGGLFGEIFKKINPTISRDLQLNECKNFIDPNSTTYRTLSQTSIEIEKEKELDINLSLKLNEIQKNNYGSKVALWLHFQKRIQSRF